MLQEKINKLPVVFKKYTIPLLISWTLIIAILAIIHFYQIRSEIIERAKIEARTIWYMNISYRKWVSNMGGVYIRKDKIPPNPYLKTPDRDKTTTDGIELTLVNSAYMMRQVLELIMKESPVSIIGRVVSEKYLNPINKPDDWEIKGLKAFEKGVQEISEIVNINGKPYMRLFKPVIIIESCLKCHGYQEYKVGDIRGGVSVAIPMQPYYKSMAKELKMVVLNYIFLWILGAVAILFLSKNIHREQQKTKESEKRLQTFFESAADWEYWVLEDKKILLMSPSCENITGYKREEFYENPKLIADIVHKDDKHICESHMTHEFMSNEQEFLEFRIITKGGEIKWLSHMCCPIYSLSGFSGRRVVNRDITDKKKLEEQLLQSQKMEAIGTLAGGVAHDFNNILTAIMGYASIMKTKMADNDPMLRYIEHILSSSERAASLTQSLLAFSRKQAINLTPLNLNDIVRKVEKLLRRLIGEDIELKTILSPVDLSIMADSVQIEQVLINLAVNARDAMPDGGVFTIETKPVRIDEKYVKRHAFTTPGMYALLCVSDTGIGMDERTKEKIFEPFFTTKDVGKGTGLGLSIVHGIIKQHNGNINVYTEPGAGTTFKIYLPMIKAEALERRINELPSPKGGTETILIAEDDKAVRELIKGVLEGSGYMVIEAIDGEDAVERFKENRDRIELVLLDVIMPRKNGKEAWQEIKNIAPHVKGIFMSGYTADIMEKKGITKQPIELISKPISPYELLRKIRMVLDG